MILFVNVVVLGAAIVCFVQGQWLGGLIAITPIVLLWLTTLYMYWEQEYRGTRALDWWLGHADSPDGE